MPITHDIDRAVAEIERLAGTPGIRGILIPTMWHDKPAYNSPVYDPVLGADMMWKWDQYFGGGHTTAKLAAMMKGKLSKLPSEYLGANIFVGASTMPLEEVRRRHVVGCDVMMWGTDYPHPEGTWPHTVEALKRSFADVPVEDTAQLVGRTAIRCYGMDEGALTAIAQRIGPPPADLGQDPARRTDPQEIAEARWWKKEYGPALGQQLPQYRLEAVSKDVVQVDRRVQLRSQIGVIDFPAIDAVQAAVVGDAVIDQQKTAELKQDRAQREGSLSAAQSCGGHLAREYLLCRQKDGFAAPRRS